MHEILCLSTGLYTDAAQVNFFNKVREGYYDLMIQRTLGKLRPGICLVPDLAPRAPYDSAVLGAVSEEIHHVAVNGTHRHGLTYQRADDWEILEARSFVRDPRVDREKIEAIVLEQSVFQRVSGTPGWAYVFFERQSMSGSRFYQSDMPERAPLRVRLGTLTPDKADHLRSVEAYLKNMQCAHTWEEVLLPSHFKPLSAVSDAEMIMEIERRLQEIITKDVAEMMLGDVDKLVKDLKGLQQRISEHQAAKKKS